MPFDIPFKSLISIIGADESTAELLKAFVEANAAVAVAQAEALNCVYAEKALKAIAPEANTAKVLFLESLERYTGFGEDLKILVEASNIMANASAAAKMVKDAVKTASYAADMAMAAAEKFVAVSERYKLINTK